MERKDINIHDNITQEENLNFCTWRVSVNVRERERKKGQIQKEMINKNMYQILCMYVALGDHRAIRKPKLVIAELTFQLRRQDRHIPDELQYDNSCYLSLSMYSVLGTVLHCWHEFYLQAKGAPTCSGERAYQELGQSEKAP